jgi:hypothetical protein
VLYDNNTPDLLLTDEPAQPKVIARKEGLTSPLWSEPEPFGRFLQKVCRARFVPGVELGRINNRVPHRRAT